MLFLYFQDSGSNPESQMVDPLPGPQPGSSRGVVRPSQTQLSKAMKKKKRVEGTGTDTDTDTELSEKTSNTQLLALLRSAINKPSTATTANTSLASFGQWVSDVTTGLHPSLEMQWTAEVSKTDAYLGCKLKC